jgi:hypothetical protein
MPPRSRGETSRYVLSHSLAVTYLHSYCSANLNTHGDQIEDHVPRHAQTTSRALQPHANDTSRESSSRRQAVDHPINEDNLGVNGEIEIDDASGPGPNNSDADDEDEDEDRDDQVAKPKQRRSRTSNSDIRPSQLRFYSGLWVDVLIVAKNNYRLFIHNEDPFPERTAGSLEDAHECLLDAIGKFKEECRLTLDEGIVIEY